MYLFFVFSRAAPVAYEDSQARGLIGAAATDLNQSHSNVGSEPFYDLHHSSQKCWILNPLSEGRDQTHNLMIPSQVY